MKYFALVFVLFLVLNPINSYAHNNASVFCDKRTASGSMNCGAMVFAHRSLRLGSIHHLCSGSRCIMARVVDRGPYVRGRDVDLSPGAARALGINGLGHVTYF